MPELRRPSPFSDLASVEAWDAWFRWRDHTGLHDTSIEDTWQRVATALTSSETGDDGARQRTRCLDALAAWRLLPDARLLADAGTGRTSWRHGALHAVLNAAAFVSHGGSPDALLALTCMADCAALAVRTLDNAAMLAGIATPHLRIGLIGIADALALLGLAYDSDAARAQAAAMARALAEGCLRGNIALAATRGAGAADTQACMARAARRDAPPELLRDARQHGLRHASLTAITTQLRLALLANDVADAADPLQGRNHAHVIAAPAGQRTIRSSGHALNVLRNAADGHAGEPDTLPDLPWTAQIAMRVALQPWMDEPIAYPLLATREPDAGQQDKARQQAALHGLGEPVWRNPAAAALA